MPVQRAAARLPCPVLINTTQKKASVKKKEPLILTKVRQLVPFYFGTFATHLKALQSR
jgi:hypothetical protein